MTVTRLNITTIIALLTTSLILPAHAGELDDIGRLVEDGKHQKALQQAERYLLQHPENERAQFLRALSQQQLGQVKTAMKNYEALTRSHPQSPEAWNNLAVLYAAQGEHNKARDALLSAINTHPSYATAYENLGNIYAKMAVSAYNRALETGNKEKAGPIELASIRQLPEAKTNTFTQVAAAAPAPVPAAVITEVKTPSQNEPEIRNIIDTVNGWVNAWSAQNVDGYLAYYARDFKPSSGLTKKRWENQRRDRLKKPRFIKVSIKNTDVFMVDPVSARFSFEQSYKSDRFNDVSRKTLVLKKIDGQWQILREYAEG